MPAPKKKMKKEATTARKVKRFSVRTDEAMHARAQAVAKYAYSDNLSEFLADAIKRRLEELEAEQRALMNARLHLSDNELKIIAAEIEAPRAPNQALADLMTNNHLDEAGYKEKLKKLLNDRNRKA